MRRRFLAHVLAEGVRKGVLEEVSLRVTGCWLAWAAILITWMFWTGISPVAVISGEVVGSKEESDRNVFRVGEGSVT